jgi:uncharacterized repeat protein (TIGR01451 family)
MNVLAIASPMITLGETSELDSPDLDVDDNNALISNNAQSNDAEVRIDNHQSSSNEYEMTNYAVDQPTTTNIFGSSASSQQDNPPISTRLAMAADESSTAVIWTDKADYNPGEIVAVFGTGFNADSNIEVNITRPNADVDTGYTTSNSTGDFIYYYDLNGILGQYNITATDGVNYANTTFWDSTIDFMQYANTDDKWIGSILGSSNSEYRESMSVPQRIILTDIGTTTGDIHTLTFSVLATKGGVHAYDFLTGWNQGNRPPLAYDPCGINFIHTTKTVCEDLQYGNPSSYNISVDVPDDLYMSKDGSTQDRIDAYELVNGNRQINITGNLEIISANLTLSHSVANLSDTGDSFIDYILTWNSSSDKILIKLAGHLSLSGDNKTNPIAWGIGLGASYISGGPYHFKLNKLDGQSLGSQDNQIKSSAIEPAIADLSVDKTGPDSAQVGETITYTFNVTNHGPSSAFDVNLTDNLLGHSIPDPLTGLTDEDGDGNNDDLAFGAHAIITAEYTIPYPGNDPVVNTALVSSVTLDNDTSNNQDDHSVDVLRTDVSIQKTGPISAHVGETITYTITIENTGEVNLTIATLNDDLLGDITGTPDSGDDGDGVFEPGETWSYDVDYTILITDPDPLLNNVTINAENDYGKDPVSDLASWDVEILYPAILAIKEANVTQAHDGDVIGYNLTVVNTGDTPLQC